MDTRTSLTMERWKRIEEIFLEVAGVPPGQQPGLLAELCGGDDELRRHVERMLTCHTEDDEFLQNPGSSPLDPDLQTRHLRGRRIGAFRLLEPIATGGMGTVWLAERTDDLQQRVALKLLNWGLVSAERRRLFEKERQALAQLEHPYITRLIDGGTTEDGVPYLVMEYVEGEPLDAFCDRQRLSIRQRLELFRKVCEAVNFAHQNLIVHRDLKPSNILVHRGGEPKLLDFGVAKLLDNASTAAQAEATITMVRAFTPRYASPEQVRGGVITTATDVYSLGVLLFELLTGAQPYDLNGSSEYERVQQICNDQPELPSRIVLNGATRTAAASPVEAGRLRSDSPEGLRRRLRGDLDTIVLKALQKDPTRRYASAEQLSEDIGRFLGGLPVRARKDTISYRLSKFVLRNRAAVVATTVVLFSLVTATVGIVMQWQSARRDRDQARRAQRTAETITTVFQNTLFTINPQQRGGNASLFMLLGDAIRQAELELMHAPMALTRVRYAVGSTYAALRAYQPAEEHLRRALAGYREESDPHDPETARCLDDLGWLRIQIGADDGVDLLREAIVIQERLYGPDQRAVADAKCRLAYGLAPRRTPEAFAEAEQLLGEAIGVYRKRFDGRHATYAFERLVRGWLAENAGDHRAAVNHYRAARDEYNATENPLQTGYVLTLERIAALMEQRGNYAAARRHRNELSGLAHTLYGEVLSHRADWAAARLEHRDAQPQAALRGYVRALTSLCLAWRRNMPVSAAELGQLGRQLDEVLQDRATDLDEIGRLCGKTVQALGKRREYPPLLRARWLVDIGAALYEAGGRHAAAEMARLALAAIADQEPSPERAAALLLQGLAHYDLGAAPAAREALREAGGIADAPLVLSADSFWHLALVLQGFDLPAEADQAVTRARAIERLERPRRAVQRAAEPPPDS